MRIAIAIDSLAGGGAEKVMLTLAKEFTVLSEALACKALVVGTNCPMGE